MPINHLFRAALLLAACAVAPLAAARDAQAAPAAAATATAAKPPLPLLWKVTGPGDARVYLLGSFHLLKPQDYPLSPDVEQAFEASQR
ncbi:TraB/GumN family protein, partial [Mesorhizobium sp. M8A.F.Ca.ET.142.01.1.1]|uniref:TraB/GumN family protein n=1 Tax=Mesorhizobium sp. M8A.F.Ca.ET.142.01.1.1 TaxID=2563958 RepID=UPI0010934130